MFDRTVVADLDTRQVLDALVERRTAEETAAVDQLILAGVWADLHPVPTGEDPASWEPRRAGQVLCGERLLRLAGEGTPEVAEFAVVDLAAHLRISVDAARSLIADALELRHRLPLLWGRMLAGQVPAWRAKYAAHESMALPPAAATRFDQKLAESTRALNRETARDLAYTALAEVDQEAMEAIEEMALQRRGVRLDHRQSTLVTDLHLTCDTEDALRFDATLDDVAAMLGQLGDADEYDVRKARAVGILADPQQAFALLNDGVLPDPAAPGDTVRTATTLYLHLDADDLEDHVLSSDTDGGGPAQIERLGPITLKLLKEWLDRTDLTIRPVLDLTRTDAIDTHDPPGWMRELVILRDQHCVFPGCHRDARACDLDHIEAYDDTGPPGQTNPANLAALCRTHHRAKTHGRWRYRRLDAHTYLWTDQYGHEFTVTVG